MRIQGKKTDNVMQLSNILVESLNKAL